MKVILVKELENDYHLEIQVNRIRTNIQFGENVFLNINGERQLFKILNCNKDTKTLMVKRFQPCVYAWTTESYKLTNTYKVGIVNWQSVDNRLKQTDTTGVLERIEKVEVFPLNVRDTKVTFEIEKEIHYRLGKVRKDREAVRGDWKTQIRPTIIKVISEFEAKPTTKLAYPTPRYYQFDASEKAARYYSKNDRGWIQWFCGTGKSNGGYWIYESVFKKIGIKNNIVIVLVPSKQLVVQTHNDWYEVAEANGNKIRSEKLGGVKDSIKSVDAIVRWLDNSTPDTLNLIVSTYQSAHKIAEALKIMDMEADFLICDEVHRLTGSQQKSWSKCLMNDYMPVRKRLSMTASPVEYDPTELGFISMSNKQLFGKCFHTYGFLDAQFDGYIAPMEIVGIELPISKVEDIKQIVNRNQKVIQKNLLKDGIDFSEIESEVNLDEGSAVFYIQLHNTLIALKKKMIKHPIIYANSVKRIRMFMACLKAMAKSYRVSIEYMNVFTSEDEIELRMKELNTKFANSKIGVVGNVYCLQEGISINAVDGIIMIDPRSSGAAIIQILGRPTRLDKKNKNKVAKIILPIIFENKNGKIVLDNTHFDTTRDWMLSIVASDSDFESLLFNGTKCITNKTRRGIEVKKVLVSKNKPSVSGRNRKGDKDDVQLEVIDFSDYKDFSELKSIISTKKSNVVARNTKDGKNKYLSNHAKTFVLGYKKKVDNAIETYNPKQISKYATLTNIDKPTLLNEFSSSYDITKQKAVSVLKEAGIDKLITQISKLDRLNYSNILNII